MSYDFSLANPEIKTWFETGKGSAPIRQFVYLHEHPLVRPSFITEIEVLIHNTGLHVIRRNITGKIIEKFVRQAEEFSTALGKYILSKEENDAMSVLEALRGIHRSCIQIQSI